MCRVYNTNCSVPTAQIPASLGKHTFQRLICLRQLRDCCCTVALAASFSCPVLHDDKSQLVVKVMCCCSLQLFEPVD